MKPISFVFALVLCTSAIGAELPKNLHWHSAELKGMQPMPPNGKTVVISFITADDYWKAEFPYRALDQKKKIGETIMFSFSDRKLYIRDSDGRVRIGQNAVFGVTANRMPPTPPPYVLFPPQPLPQLPPLRPPSPVGH